MAHILDELHEKITVNFHGQGVSRLVERYLTAPEATARRSERRAMSTRQPRLFLALEYLRALRDMRRELLSGDVTQISGSALFVPTIGNNLNSMLPLAEALQSAGVRCVFILPSRSWKPAKRIPRQFTKMVASNRGLCGDVSVKKAVSGLRAQMSLHLALWAMEGVKPFPHLLDRSAFRRFMIQSRNVLATLQEAENIFGKHRPLMVIGGRPKRAAPVSYLAAAKNSGVPTVFASHTIWLRYAERVPAFYDLSIFDKALLFSTKCAEVARSTNPRIEAIVTGWPKSSDDKASSLPTQFTVGYPASGLVEGLSEILPAIEKVDCHLLVKTHPPGGDAERFRRVVPEHLRHKVTVVDHTDLSLQDFLNQSSVVLCGRTNVAFDAASTGRLVLSHEFEFEKRFDGSRHALESEDISVLTTRSAQDLESVLAKLAHSDKGDLEAVVSTQSERYRATLPLYEPDKVVAELLRNVAPAMKAAE